MSNLNLSDDVSNQWSEVLSGVAVNAIPYNYINSLTILFKNKKSWNINIDTLNSTEEELFKFEQTINEMMYVYKDHINDLDFSVDILKIKSDVELLTKQFLEYNGL